MKEICDWALNTASQRGAQYADVRIVDDRSRNLATKNGKVSHASSSESLGVGIRVLVNDSWGFASTDDLSRESVDRTTAQAIEIARSQSAKAWELRAVMSLSRLWQQQGRQEDARQMLTEIYGWFTEGFDTADLKEAKALLQELIH